MTTDTKTKSASAILEGVVVETNAIERVTPTAGAQIMVPTWTRERIELLKKAVCPKEITDAEFELFLEQCKRTGLDPLLKQAYCIERKQKIQDARGAWVWVVRFEFQAAEAGLAIRADLQPDFRGIKGAAVYEGDEIAIDAVGLEIVHKFKPGKDRGKLIGAWAQAYREGRVIPVTYLPLESRLQTNGQGEATKFWRTMPEGQILKCARAEQYRLAFPSMFAGVYIPEELPDPEDERQESEAAAEDGERQKKIDQVKAKLGVETPAKPSPTMTFGPKTIRGRRIAELETEDLRELLKVGREKVDGEKGKKSKERWFDSVSANVEAIAAELERRALEAEKQPAPADDVAPPAAPGFNPVKLEKAEEDVPF
jgi:phage recombination protein Bet